MYSFDYLAEVLRPSRLAEDPSLTIGVIEAGNFLWDDPLVNVPGTMVDYHLQPISDAYGNRAPFLHAW